MPVDTSTVEIVVNVTDANSGAAIGGVERNLTQLGTAGQAAGKKVGAGLGEISGHALTSLDNVRLLRDDLGIRIPRSMERAIAQSHMLSTAIGSIGSGLLAVGAIDIGIRIAEGLKQSYDNYLSMTAAAKTYADEMEKARKQDFGDTHSIETTTARIKEATDAIIKYTQVSESVHTWSTIGRGLLGDRTAGYDLAVGTGASRQAIDSQKQLDALQERERDQIHEKQLQQIELNHAQDGELLGHRKITAELAKHKEINAEERRYNRERESAHGNAASDASGASDEAIKNSIAERQAKAEDFNLDRAHAQELQKLRADAAEAGLRGAALYRQQELDALNALKGTDKDNIDYRNAIHDKFHNGEMRRLDEERAKVGMRTREAGGAGLTGIAKVRYEGQSRDQDILADEAGGKYQRFGDALNDHASNVAKTNAEILAAEQSFTQRVDQLSDESAAHQVSGFARIHAEGQRQISALRQEFEKTYGKDASNPDYQAHVGELNRGAGIIDSGARDQEVELARRNSDETAQIEAQARAKMLGAEKQQTAAIEAQHEERIAAYKKELNQKLIEQGDYNRRVAAADLEMNAELIEQARESREKIAGEIQGLFSAHPLEALQRMGEKYAAQASAAVIQRATTHFGIGTNGGGSVIDRIAGMPHLNAHPNAETPTGIKGLASSGTIGLQTATIYVTNGTFAGGGGFSAGAGARPFGGSASTAAFGGGFGGGGSPDFSGSSSAGFSGGAFNGFGSGGAGSSPAGAIVPGGSPPPPGAGFAGMMGSVNQGFGTIRDLSNLFHGGGPSSAAGMLTNTSKPAPGLETQQQDLTQAIGGGTLNADGTVTKSGFGSSMLGGGMTASNTLGAAGAGLGLFSAYKQGGVGGMLSGTLSGAQLGMEVGGPIGAAIGAVGGAVLGLVGGGEQARVWWLKNGRTRLSNDMDSFEHGGMDYLSAYMDIEQLKTEAHLTLSKMGMVGSRYYHDNVTREIGQAEAKLTREQKAGRTAGTFSTAQFAAGADYVPRDGMAYIHEGERITPSDQNERITRAMEGMSSMPTMASAGYNGPDIHVHAINTKDGVDFLLKNSEAVRAALTQSYGNYGGEADNGGS